MTRSELEEMIVEEIEAALAEIAMLDEKYTSAGTVPRVHGRTMTPAQVAAREQLGVKILRAVKGGGKNNRLRRAFIRWAQKNDKPITSQKIMNSYAWAMASDWAIKGKDFPPAGGPKKSSGGEESPKSTPPQAKAPEKEKPTKPAKEKPSTPAKETPKKSPKMTAPKKAKAKSPAKKAGSKEKAAPARKINRKELSRAMNRDLRKLIAQDEKKAKASASRKSTKLKEIIQAIENANGEHQ